VITGKFTDPRDLGIDYPEIEIPTPFLIDDNMIIKPDNILDPSSIKIYRGPNIGPPPENTALTDKIEGVVSIKAWR